MNSKRRFIGLKAKIMLSTLIPVVASFALISLMIFLSLFNAQQETARAEFMQISQSYAHEFETKINVATNYLSILSSDLEAQLKTGIIDRERLQERILYMFKEYQLLNGSSVYFESNQYDGRDAEYQGTNYGTEKSGKIAWYFYQVDGQTAYLPEGLANELEFEMSHYTRAKAANAPIYTDPVTLEVNGVHIPMFTITYPINNEDGAFIGAVTVDLFLDDIYRQLQAEQIYESGYIIVSNDNEQIIYSPRYLDIGKTHQDAGLDYPLPTDIEVSDFFTATSILNGKETLMAVVPVHIPHLDSVFYVSIAAPLHEINAAGIQLTTLFLAINLVVIAVIAGLIFFLVRKISAPLNEITESVDKIAGGEYDVRIEGAYKGEFAILRDSVNKMANSIETYIGESSDTLSILTNILNGLDAFIYVTVPDTGEILFINDQMKHHYHLSDDCVGQICYKVLQEGMDARCSFCPCFHLDKEPDTAIVWEEASSLTRRNYRNTDRYINWIDGRKAHLQHSVDITDLKEIQLTLDKRIVQQALMITISQSFLSGGDIYALIAGALRQIGEFIGISQILYFQYEGDNTFTCLAEWINPETGKQSGLGIRQTVPQPLIDDMKNLSKENAYCLNSKDPAIREYMAHYTVNFENYISLPIFVKGELYGALDIFREEVDRDWSESEIHLGVLVTSLLSGVFERNKMEGQLRMLSSIVESSPQFIFYLTADGNIDYVNPAALDITGYAERELAGGGLGMIFDEKTVQDIKEVYIPDTLKNGTGTFEINLFCKDGRKRIMAFSSFITGLDSSNVGGIASDVTEIRKLESELIAAKELAEQGSRSKSEFLSRMSHEMRTPMNAVIGMTSIAKNSDDPEKKEYCLDRIDNASRHLLGVINDILDMSKIEANRFELSCTEFGFDRMLRRVLDVINFRIDEKHQTFSLYVEPSIPATLIGDEQRLAQVITNLLSNAVKFTPEDGTIKLAAHLLAEQDGELTLQIEVSDSGIGISEEQQRKLFHSFEQADGSIARKFGGTGLGLAISKKIIDLMGGEVWIESELGHGSTFIFTMKAKRGKAGPVELLKKHINIGDLNIMVVDDSLEVRDYFKHVMDSIGAPCVVASGGEEALALFKGAEKPFNLLFVDWQMPKINGIELTKRLRQLSLEQPVVIMISVAEWADIEQEALWAGVNDFVPKPLFPSLLVDCINKHIGIVVADDPKNTEETKRVSLAGKTALLAEDVEINREIVLTVLADTMLQIDCAENGRQAVEMFMADPGRYDVIFMDIHMPEVDGFEATRRIRKLDIPQGNSVPIVAMTANVFSEDIQKCLDVGMNDHIGKPIDFEELFSVLDKYLGAHES